MRGKGNEGKQTEGGGLGATDDFQNSCMQSGGVNNREVGREREKQGENSGGCKRAKEGEGCRERVSFFAGRVS